MTYSDSQSVVPPGNLLEAFTPPGNLLEMQILGFIQDLLNQKLQVWCPAITSLPGDSDAC